MAQPRLPFDGEYDRYLAWKQRLLLSQKDHHGQPLTTRRRRYAYAVALAKAIGNKEAMDHIDRNIDPASSGFSYRLSPPTLERFIAWAEEIAWQRKAYL